MVSTFVTSLMVSTGKVFVVEHEINASIETMTITMTMTFLVETVVRASG